jgi:hypothetical protein
VITRNGANVMRKFFIALGLVLVLPFLIYGKA